MAEVPSYSKVLTLGGLGTEQALVGPLTVEEKIDGSQFAFGIDENGELGCRSHHQQIVMDEPGMFAEAVEHVRRMAATLPGYGPAMFYCEYLQKPKHNTLAYSGIPLNHLVLFDVFAAGGWASPERLQFYADDWQIDSIPVLWQGTGCTTELLKELLGTSSYLGGTTVEGVVVKNYGQLVAIGGRTYPLFCKLVNTAFKERNDREWKENSGRNKLDVLINSFGTEARWQKAVQHLAEQGVLEHSPRDIGNLMREVAADLMAEETENIKQELFELYRKDILRSAQRGLPEWYKEQLLGGASS